MRELRRRIRSYRTRYEVAELLSVSQPTVSSICTLKVNRFSLDKLIFYAAQLGIRLDWRLTYTEEKDGQSVAGRSERSCGASAK